MVLSCDKDKLKPTHGDTYSNVSILVHDKYSLDTSHVFGLLTFNGFELKFSIYVGSLQRGLIFQYFVRKHFS